MKKEDKGLIIGQLTEIVKEYPNFYLTDIEALKFINYYPGMSL